MQLKPGFIILILGALATITPFSIDMYLPSFQQIADELGSTTQHVALTLSSYFVGFALGQLVYGPFLDRFGRKRPLFIGLAIYMLSSWACSQAATVDQLIALRFFQAIGGCAASVSATAMVRDFFPAKESAKVFSLLMLVIGVSPFFAPTVGSLVTVAWGWRAVFGILAAIVALIALVVKFILPEGHQPDPSFALKPRMIALSFWRVLQEPRFLTYSFAGGFAFSGLFAYLAAAPAIYLGEYQIGEKLFGVIFAGLSVGVIGGGQINIVLTRRFSSERIFAFALVMQSMIATALVAGAAFDWLNFYTITFLFFAFLSAVGLTYPNAAAIALMPFEKNAGTAASLLGFIQMGTGATVSAIFGFLKLGPAFAVSALFLLTSVISLLILTVTRRDPIADAQVI